MSLKRYKTLLRLLVGAVLLSVAWLGVKSLRTPMPGTRIVPTFSLPVRINRPDPRTGEFATLPHVQALLERLYAELDAIHEAGTCAQFPWAGVYRHRGLHDVDQKVVIAPSGFVAYEIGCTGVENWSSGTVHHADHEKLGLAELSGDNHGWQIEQNYRVSRLGPSVSLVPVYWFGASGTDASRLSRCACSTCDAPFTTTVVRIVADDTSFATKMPRAAFHDTLRWVQIDKGREQGFLSGLKLYAVSPSATVPVIHVRASASDETRAMFTFGDTDPGGPRPGDVYSTRPPITVQTGQSGLR